MPETDPALTPGWGFMLSAMVAVVVGLRRSEYRETSERS